MPNGIVTHVETTQQTEEVAVREAVREALPDLARQAVLRRVLTQRGSRSPRGFSDRELRYLRETKQAEHAEPGRSRVCSTPVLPSFQERTRIRGGLGRVPTVASPPGVPTGKESQGPSGESHD